MRLTRRTHRVGRIERLSQAAGRAHLEPLEPRRLLAASFETAVALDAGTEPKTAVFADFDGDDVLDLAVGGRGTVAVLLGVGDGTFDAPTIYDFGSGSAFVTSGDLDGDGDEDLVIAESGASRAVALYNAGDGTFGNATEFTAGVEPVDVELADFNNDGDLDVAVLNLIGQTVSLHLSDGAGGYADPLTYSGGTFPTSIVAADFDNDGQVDMATASLGFGSGSAVRILRNLGGGIFTATASLAVGGQPQEMAVGDLDGDGFADLVTANQTTEDVSVLLNAGDGSFEPVVGYSTGVPLTGVTLADFDLDGDLDIATTNNLAAGQMFVFDNQGDGSFDDGTTFTVASRPQAVVAGDVDGDGDPDVVVVAQSDVVLLINQAVIPGTTVPAQPDLVAASDSGSSTSDNVTLFNNTTGATLTFNVSGVTAGALIRLFADGNEIGQAIAAGTSVSITTGGLLTLADGAHQITATSEVGGDVSAPSEALTLTVDSTSPIFTSSAVTDATAGQVYSYDPETTEEGDPGLVYTLLTGPDGMEMNVITGALGWTPTSADLGIVGVSLRATDLAGNTADQTYGITVTTAGGATFDPSDREQYLLELLNRMRLDPAAEIDLLLDSTDPGVIAALAGFDVDEDVLRQQWADLNPTTPLAWNEALYNAAVGHSELMRDFDEQSHQLPGEVPLGQRVLAEGYNFTTVGENVYAFGQNVFHTHAAFAIDWGLGPNGIQDPPGHRLNMMNPAFAEIGIGIVDTADGNSTGPLLITQDLGNRADLVNPYLLGVIYTDSDQDGAYDEGEGVSGATARAVGDAGTFTATSLSAGGYQMILPAGDYTVTFSGAAFSVPVTTTVTVGAGNVKVDAVTPPAAPAAPDLLNSSDTGASVVDNVTAYRNDTDTRMEFTIVGVTAGATVKLYAGATLIGEAVAEASVVVITTNGSDVLADGTYDLTATQTIGDLTGAASEPLEVVIDATDPVFTSAAETEGNAATPYVYDAETDEEGADGLQYELRDGPRDMTIDIDTGIVRWSPAANDLGDHEVSIRVTDLAGNTTDQDYLLSIEPVLVSGPDLLASIGTVTLPDTYVPGDKATVGAGLKNLGDVKVDAFINVRYYVSATADFSGDTMLIAEVTGKRLRLSSGKSTQIKAKINVDDTYPLGEYYLAVEIDTSDAVDELNEDNNLAVSSAIYDHVYAFGNVDGRSNVKMVATDANGVLVEYQLRGNGRGDLAASDTLDAFDLMLTGTNVDSKVLITPKGKDATTVIASVDGNGHLGEFLAKDVDLLGDFTLFGGTEKLLLHDVVAGSTLAIGALADATATADVQFNLVADLSATIDTPVRLFRLVRWLDTDGTADSLTGTAVEKVLVTGDRGDDIDGDFQAALVLGGATGFEYTLKIAQFKGELDDGVWDVTGPTKKVTADNVGPNWQATFVGAIDTFDSKLDFAGDLTATRVGTFKVKEDASGSLTLTQAVNADVYALLNLNVGQWLDGFTLRSDGNVKNISARGARNSLLFAGVDPDIIAFPDPVTDFDSQASIEKVNIKGVKDAVFSFENTNIAAYSLGRLSYRDANTDNGGVQFGLAAHDLNCLVYKDERGTFKWPNRDEPDGPADDGDRVTRLA